MFSYFPEGFNPTFYSQFKHHTKPGQGVSLGARLQDFQWRRTVVCLGLTCKHGKDFS